MAVHIFQVSEENYKICVEKGIVALPEPKETSSHDIVFDGLLSRLSGIKEDDFVLIYVIKQKVLRGIWRVDGEPFYEETPIWEDRLYPFRCRIKWSQYNFNNPIMLDEINDMRSHGIIWTWALERATGSNAMFSISNNEFNTILTEYMKKNPFTIQKGIIRQPYPYHSYNLLEKLHFDNGNPKYEYTIMALLNKAFTEKRFTEIFGNYTDHLCYIPTNLGKEMDVMLMYEHPLQNNQVVSYDIIEVKRNSFDEDALKQLISYESWFLQKKVAGDSNMVRTTAIAKSYSKDVVDYVKKRTIIENKPIKLLTYSFVDNDIKLTSVV